LNDLGAAITAAEVATPQPRAAAPSFALVSLGCLPGVSGRNFDPAIPPANVSTVVAPTIHSYMSTDVNALTGIAIDRSNTLFAVDDIAILGFPNLTRKHIYWLHRIVGHAISTLCERRPDTDTLEALERERRSMSPEGQADGCSDPLFRTALSSLARLASTAPFQMGRALATRRSGMRSEPGRAVPK
jgi:hypothetical protein